MATHEQCGADNLEAYAASKTPSRIVDKVRGNHPPHVADVLDGALYLRTKHAFALRRRRLLYEHQLRSYVLYADHRALVCRTHRPASLDRIACRAARILLPQQQGKARL